MEKGKTNNPNGRPSGTPNKVTTELKQWISNLIDNNKEQFEADLANVEPEKRLLILEKLLQYVIPKQRENQLNLEDESMKNALYDKFFNREK